MLVPWNSNEDQFLKIVCERPIHHFRIFTVEYELRARGSGEAQITPTSLMLIRRLMFSIDEVSFLLR